MIADADLSSRVATYRRYCFAIAPNYCTCGNRRHFLVRFTVILDLTYRLDAVAAAQQLAERQH